MKKNSHYVYQHRDPRSNKIVYVGHGSRGRAWACGSRGTVLRSQPHQDWFDELMDEGFLPDDWVEVVYIGLTKEDAKDKEKELIHELKPIYNKSIRYPLLKFTVEVYGKAKALREEGLTYEAVGKAVGLSTMVVHRGLTGKSISLETALAEK